MLLYPCYTKFVTHVKLLCKSDLMNLNSTFNSYAEAHRNSIMSFEPQLTPVVIILITHRNSILVLMLHRIQLLADVIVSDHVSDDYRRNV